MDQITILIWLQPRDVSNVDVVSLPLCNAVRCVPKIKVTLPRCRLRAAADRIGRRDCHSCFTLKLLDHALTIDVEKHKVANPISADDDDVSVWMLSCKHPLRCLISIHSKSGDSIPSLISGFVILAMHGIDRESLFEQRHCDPEVMGLFYRGLHRSAVD